MRAAAMAHPNIALVKYWGKRDATRNLPYRGSLAVTVAPLCTWTRVTLHDRLGADRVLFQGEEASPAFAGRVERFLAQVRDLAGRRVPALVETAGTVPLAAGLAGSSAGFAALALAASRAYGLHLDARRLSRLARLGSGSACRSIHGGFTEWLPGESADGADSHAVPVAPSDHWDLAVIMAIVDPGPKPVSSRDAMARCDRTSPLFRAWLRRVDRDLPVVREAVLNRDLTALGQTMEVNTLAMFATLWTAEPPIFYWRPGTVETLQTVRRLREAGVGAWFTVDAGPNVKILCRSRDVQAVCDRLAAVSQVQRTIVCRVGGPARLVSADAQPRLSS